MALENQPHSSKTDWMFLVESGNAIDGPSTTGEAYRRCL